MVELLRHSLRCWRRSWDRDRDIIGERERANLVARFSPQYIVIPIQRHDCYATKPESGDWLEIKLESGGVSLQKAQKNRDTDVELERD